MSDETPLERWSKDVGCREGITSVVMVETAELEILRTQIRQRDAELAALRKLYDEAVGACEESRREINSVARFYPIDDARFKTLMVAAGKCAAVIAKHKEQNDAN